MLIAEAHIDTERPSRYLVQFCRHANEEAQAHPEMQAHVEWTDDRGLADFGWGRCTLRADSGVLTLRAEAPDQENLQRVEHLVAEHVERFGTGDHLTVTWTPPQGAGEQLPNQPPDATDDNAPG